MQVMQPLDTLSLPWLESGFAVTERNFLAIDALKHVNVNTAPNKNILRPIQGVEYGSRSLEEKAT